MQVPKFLVKTYHGIPIPKKTKLFLRKKFYDFLIPIIKTKRNFQISKKITFKGISEIKEYKNNIGVCKCSNSYFGDDFFIVYPLMISLSGMFDEILKESIYFKYSKIKKGDFVIDAGSNIGIFSVLASVITGNSGNVICLEPDPLNIEFLNWNKGINKLKNIKIIEKALWMDKEKIDFYINTLYSAASGVYSGHSNKIKIQADSLDNILKDFDFKNKDIFLKMDIEGAEVEAIKGMKDLLKYSNLRGVIAAYHKVPEKDNFEKIIRAYTIVEPILKGAGFKVINEGGFLYFWKDEKK